MVAERGESRLRQGIQGTLFVVGLGLTIILVGLALAALATWTLT